MLAAFTILPINYALRQESWASKWLQTYEGKTVCIRIPPLASVKLIVLANGEFGKFDDGDGEVEVDTTLSVLPAIVPRLIARDETAFDNISISGDAMFAEDLITIGKNLKPGIEQDLGNYIGDIPAHRIATTGSSLLQWHVNLFRNVSDTLGEYFLEEQPMIVKPGAVKTFSQQNDALKDRLDQLETRINRIIQRSSA